MADGELDSLDAIGDEVQGGAAGGSRDLGRRRDLLEDRQAILPARILVGDHDHVGQPRRDPAHGSALLPVALPRRPEDRPQPSGGRRPQLAEHRLQGDRRVRVVDHHREVLAEVDALHPPVHPLQGGDAADRGLEGDVAPVDAGAAPAGRGQRRQRIGRVEAAGQPEPDLHPAPRRGRHEMDASGINSQVLGDEVGVGVTGGAVGEPACHRHAGEAGIGEVVVAVEDGQAIGPRPHHPQQALLGAQILLAAAVDVEVLGGDPGVDGEVVVDVVDPVQVEAVGRGLHRGVGAPGGRGGGQEALQLGGFEGGDPARAGTHVVADPQVDGGDAGRLLPRRLPGCPEHGGGGGLAVRAGDPGHRHPPGRMPGQGGRERAQGSPGALDPQQRCGLRDRRDRGALGDDRDGSGPDGRPRKVVTVDVKTGDRDEERSRAAVAGVVLDRGHLGVAVARDVETRLAEELGEQHRSACPSTPDPSRPAARTPRGRRRWFGTSARSPPPRGPAGRGRRSPRRPGRAPARG